MAIAEDASAPTAVTGTTTTTTTASFTPAANSLIVAISTCGNNSGVGTLTAPVTDSLGSTWTLLRRANGDGLGSTEVWAMDAGASPSARTATVTGTGGANAVGVALCVKVLTGTEPLALVLGASAIVQGTTAYTIALVSTTAGSLVVGGLVNIINAGTLTVNTDTTAWQAVSDTTNTERYGAWRAASLTGSPGSLTYGYTNVAGQNQSIVAVELLEVGTAPPVAFVATGTKQVTASTTTVSLALPASTPAEDLLIAGRSIWTNVSAVAADEAGWTPGGDLFGGTGTAADAHTSRIRTDYKEATGSDTDPTVFDQSGTISGVMGIIARYRKFAGTTWDVVFTTGTDNTHAADRSVTGSGSLAFAPGDVLIAVVAVDTDVSTTITSPALTASGITFGSTNRRTSGAGSGGGQDGNIEWFDAAVSSGSGTAAPALAFTTATTQCGPVAFMRLRAVSAGNNYAETPTDNLGLTDTIIIDLVKGVSDNLGLTDSTSMSQGKSTSDSLGLTDTVALSQGRAVSDSLGMTDSVVVDKFTAVNASDTEGLTDTTALAQGKVQSDPMGLTDSVGLSLSMVISDGMGLTDSTAVDKGLAVTTSDNLGLTDSTALAQGKGVSDSLGLTDSVVVAFEQGMSVSDDLGLTDVATLSYRLLQAFDSGTNGSNITAGDNIQSVSGTPTFTTDSKHGGLAMGIGVGAPTNVSTFVRIDQPIALPTHSLSMYHKPVSQSASFTTLVRWADTSNNPILSIAQTATKFDLRDEVGTTIASTASNWLVQYYRSDIQIDLSTPTAPAITWRLFASPEATSPTETITQTLSATRTFARWLIGAVGAGGGGSTRELRVDTFRAGDGLFWWGPFDVGLVQDTSDNEDLTDTVSFDLSKTTSDDLGLTDTVAVVQGKSTSDALGLTDTASVSIGRSVTNTDNLGMTDSIAISLSKVISDPLGLTESVSTQLASAGAVSATDPEGLTDTVALSLSKVTSDNLGMTDSVSIVITRGVSDNMGLTDVVTVNQTFERVVSDAVGLSDSVFVVLNGGIEAFRVDITGVAVYSRNPDGPAVRQVDTGVAVGHVTDGVGTPQELVGSVASVTQGVTGPDVSLDVTGVAVSDIEGVGI